MEQSIPRVLLKARIVGRSLKGVTGGNYMELLNLLCNDFQPKVKEKVLQKLQCSEQEVIVFDIFKSAVFTCLVLADFLEQATDLYKLLDVKNDGAVDTIVCESLNQQLQQAVNMDTSHTLGIMEAGHLLSPEKTYSSLSEALYERSSSTKGSTMTCSAFVASAAESFLSKVKRIR